MAGWEEYIAGRLEDCSSQYDTMNVAPNRSNRIYRRLVAVTISKLFRICRREIE